MRITSALLLTVLVQTCSAGLWGSSKSDPIKAEKDLPSAPTSKYDYKMSFKKPYYFNGTIPFWNTSGDILKSDEFIRLSPSVPNTSGAIWSVLPNPYEEWEVEIAFKVTGNHVKGGRGLAFWYTKDSMEKGPVFGSKDKWDGLSVWLDSANPVTHKATAMVILNDGTHAFTAGADPVKLALNSCSVGYRNAYHSSHLKVSYKDHTLTVSVDDGIGMKDYRTCSQSSGIKLPSGYYFGVSAASHSPADDHDIISFSTHQLNPPQKIEHTERPLEEQKKKKGEEFKGIHEEQKKKIEEAEFQMRRLRESADNGEEEVAANMAAIFDVQRRAVETLSILQMQIEALGAPNPQDILNGKFRKEQAKKMNDKTSNDGAIVQELQIVIDQLKEEFQNNMKKFEKVIKEQGDKMNDIKSVVMRLEEAYVGSV
ncbi:legume-like lectin family-domain-containing protein [Pilobolus umbonatus]|nr:legume-like lectin family-domain-containing protein [Pilobolus umbonatus]